MMSKDKKRYSDLKQFSTFEERFDFLKLNGSVGEETFGFDRYINQKFYRSEEWKKIRNDVIVRDNGTDLGIKDKEIIGKIIVHHMNPITKEDIENREEWVFNPDYLICVSPETHRAIHYGDSDMISKTEIIERKPNDTCPWR